jgi:hypothetical protein
MDNDNNSINSNWNVGTSANGVHENVLEEQSEQQVRFSVKITQNLMKNKFLN